MHLMQCVLSPSLLQVVWLEQLSRGTSIYNFVTLQCIQCDSFLLLFSLEARALHSLDCPPVLWVRSFMCMSHI